MVSAVDPKASVSYIFLLSIFPSISSGRHPVDLRSRRHEAADVGLDSFGWGCPECGWQYPLLAPAELRGGSLLEAFVKDRLTTVRQA